MLSTAVNWQYIKANPLENVKPPKVARKQADHYEEEVLEMLSKLEHAPIKYQCAIAIALFGGLRLGEIAALEWSDLDFDKHMLIVNKQLKYDSEIGIYEKEPKTDSGDRIVSLDEMVFEQLKVYKEWQEAEKQKMGALWQDHNKLFTQADGKPIFYHTISHWWSDWLETEGLRPLKFHGLRHTSATYQIAHDVDGHSLCVG
ncbi:MAG: site-specific integrase [Clostridiales bacterium]|jgi:integrase|nr:site-specific integrase [Clostridiales bacterium]